MVELARLQSIRSHQFGETKLKVDEFVPRTQTGPLKDSQQTQTGPLEDRQVHLRITRPSSQAALQKETQEEKTVVALLGLADVVCAMNHPPSTLNPQPSTLTLKTKA